MTRTVVSERGRVRRVLVVGSGVAGAMTALRLCERGIPVQILCAGSAGEAGSAALRGGIAAAGFSAKDDPERHFRDTLATGEFLQHQAPLRAMCGQAAAIVDRLIALGVSFARTGQSAAGGDRTVTGGGFELMRSPGASQARTLDVRTGIGRQVLSALLAALRRYEVTDVTDARGSAIPGEARLTWLEHHELVSLVVDDNGVVVGAAIQDRRSLKIRSVTADAVCLASGGAAGMFGRATAGSAQNGAALGRAMRQGAVLANPEFVQFCPIAIPGPARAHALPPSVLALGARIWVPRDVKDSRRPTEIPERERSYLLERFDSELGSLLPADQACRVIQRWLRQGNALHDAQTGELVRGVYLDATHLPDSVQGALAGQYELYRRFTGSTSWRDPMVVEPAAHATLGGLWVDHEMNDAGTLVEASARNQATNLPGLYAAGGAACQFSGAARLEDNVLLANVFGATLAADAIEAYRGALSKSPHELPISVFERASEREDEAYSALFGEGNGDTARGLLRELGEVLREHCGIERDDSALERAASDVDEIAERALGARATGSPGAAHSSALDLRDVRDVSIVARATLLAARTRAESRGSHFKPARAARDDANWLRTSCVALDGNDLRVVSEVTYACTGKQVRRSDAVETHFIPAEPRRQGRADKRD